MRTSYCLGTVAVLAAIAGAVYTGLPAAATPPAVPSVPLPPPKSAAWVNGEPPELPPIVVDPDVVWPVRVPERRVSPARAEVVKPAAPARLPVAPPPKPVAVAKPAAPALPSVALPPVPMPIATQPEPSPLPTVPPPPVVTRPQPATPPVPPVTVAPPKPLPTPKPAPLPAVPPPAIAKQPLPAPPVAAQPKPATPSPLPPVPPPASVAKKPEPQPALPLPTPIAQPARPSVGQAILLQDGKIVEGTVAKEGEKVIVRRGVIDQPFEKDKVQFIGESKDGVYRYLLGKLKPDDADGRFKLARWCVFNGMREQALTEVREVVKLQPQHALAREMARTLEESIRLFNADGSPTNAPATPGTSPAPGLPAVPPPTTQAAPAAPNAVVEQQLDVSPEAVLVFGPRVQPILVNGCAECHAKADYAGSFKMACGSGHGADAQATRQNLVAAIGQITRQDPAASPLLVKSLSIHGGQKRPGIIGPHVPAYRVLEAWVYLAAGSSEMPATPPAAAPAPALPPKPAEPELPPKSATPALPPPPIPPAAEPKPLPPAIPPAAPEPDFGVDAPPKEPATAPDPASTKAPVDDFDPSIFNRAVHPESIRVPAAPR